MLATPKFQVEVRQIQISLERSLSSAEHHAHSAARWERMAPTSDPKGQVVRARAEIERRPERVWTNFAASLRQQLARAEEPQSRAA